MTIGRFPGLPGPLEVLDAVQQAGYEGIDLGPVGFLGTDAELAERLGSRGLGLAGGYCAIRFTRADLVEEDLEALKEVLAAFSAADAGAPKPTLADAGSPERAAAPGGGDRDPTLRLDGNGWRRLAEAVGRAVEMCRAAGFEPTFHHHAATYVEAPAEIERLLELTDVGLCLDTGHLLLGGGDPLEALAAWGERINHVHLKDVRLQVVDLIVHERAPVEEIWRRQAFCPLGKGDLDVDGFLEGLVSSAYRGWVVVEQDHFPSSSDPLSAATADQVANRRFLAERGF